MKYEIIVNARSEWAYTVEANSADEAMATLREAIDEGQESDFPCQLYDTGSLELTDLISPLD
jgi:hypothetical protein